MPNINIPTRKPLSKIVNNKGIKKPLAKPSWDSCHSDLNQFKASSGELEQRKLSHKSKHIDQARQEIHAKQQSKKEYHNQLKSESRSQLTLLKEILHDDEHLKNLILKSDSTLKVVQGFFDDDNDVEYTGKKAPKISLTLAPNVTDLNESNLPHYVNKCKKSTITEAPVSNLNNLSNEDEYCSDDGLVVNNAEDKEFNLINEKLKQLKLNNDMDKYYQLVELKRKLVHEQNSRKAAQKQKEFDVSEVKELLRSLNNHLGNDGDKPKSAKKASTDETGLFINKSNLSMLNDEFKRALGDLDNKLAEFESLVGKQRNLSTSAKRVVLSGSSNYTLTLIQAISTLIDYLREVTIECNYEKVKQVEMSKQLDIHRKLIDGLTTEILCVKEQNEKITNDFARQNNKLEAEFEQMKIFLKTTMSSKLPSSSVQIQYQPTPPVIDPRPKTSAFSVQSYSSPHNNNLDVPQYQQLVKPVPAHLSEIYNSPILPATDKFSERLNAMLHNEHANNRQPGLRTQSATIQPYNDLYSYANRPMSASASLIFRSDLNTDQLIVNNGAQSKFNSSNFHSISTANQVNDDFTGEISELKMQNLEAHEKLRQLQHEQQQLSINFKLEAQQQHQAEINKQNEENNNVELDEHARKKKELLDKLKREQTMLREQISMLNKQRESAQKELDCLSGNGSNNGVVVDATNKTSGTGLKNMFEISQTLNLSPIANDNKQYKQ